MLQSVYEASGHVFEPSAAMPNETTSSRSDGGPEGVRAAGPNHLFGRAVYIKGLSFIDNPFLLLRLPDVADDRNVVAYGTR